MLAHGCASIPQGQSGPAADALAREVETWVDRDAWDRTGALTFRFGGFRTFVWDRQRELVLVRTDDIEVQLDLRDRGGLAFKATRPIDGAELRALLDDAWSWFCNDTFWLNPLVKLFDLGTRREVVATDEGRGLKVTYSSGGVTPGDTYVWLVGEGGQPLAVRMWVQVLPVRGVEFRWGGWVTLETGAKIGTTHTGPGRIATPGIGELHSAATVRELVGHGAADPFALLVARRAELERAR